MLVRKPASHTVMGVEVGRFLAQECLERVAYLALNVRLERPSFLPRLLFGYGEVDRVCHVAHSTPRAAA